MRTFVRRKAKLDAREDAILLFDHAGQLEYYLQEQKERDHIDEATGDSGKNYVVLDRISICPRGQKPQTREPKGWNLGVVWAMSSRKN